MDLSLLSSKYHLPPAGPNWLERGSLLQKLDGGLALGKRLLLICAPAGYGKTTLAAGWAQRIVRSTPAAARLAWLTCDPEEDDLARFLAYLTAALGQVDPGIGQGLLAGFHASRPPAPPAAAVQLLNDLARVPDRLVLVLDDFHTLTSPPIHEFMNYLVEHQPLQLCLVLVTRADPPLPLARLRGRGQLLEIRQNELAFSPAECADFLSRTSSLSLTAEQLAALERRTEGWAAGLQLAALSMNSVPDAAAFLEAFSGGHEYIADYLADEVLARQPAAIQSFLLQTSILERLSAPLCAAVTGEPEAQEILESLREQNLFLVPLDHQRQWYRYHALFADLLRSRLNQAHALNVDELHQRASQWYAEAGMYIPAVEHALAGQAVEGAAALVEQALEPVFIRGQVSTLLRWLEVLPAELKNRRPMLWIFHGLGLIWGGKSSAAVQPFLAELVPAFSTGGWMGELHTLQALYALTGGSPAEAARLAQSALQECPPARALFRCLASDTLGMANILQCETAAAIQAFELTAEIAAQAGFVKFEVMAYSHLAGLRLQQGQLQASALGYRRALELASHTLGRRSPVIGNILLGLGELAREGNDLEGALAYFSEAAEMFAQFSEMGVPIACLSIARVKAAQGDWKSAQEYLEQARQTAQDSRATRLNDRLVAGLQARFWIRQGEAGLAEQWARESGLFDHPITGIIQAAGRNAAGSEFIHNDYLTLARLHLLQNQPDLALQVLDPLLEVSESMGYMRQVLHILVLQALALQQKKEPGPAVNVLGRALALAEPGGTLRVFLEEGEPLAKLLYQALAGGICPAYAAKVLAAFSPPSSAAAIPAEKKSLLEPLSERELEVLGLIAAGLSNRQISARLHISLSTVKGHTANIYGKLGVNSRTQALAEAARLGLLI